MLPGVVVHACNSAIQRLRQEDCLKFKASLGGYIVRPCINPPSPDIKDLMLSNLTTTEQRDRRKLGISCVYYVDCGDGNIRVYVYVQSHQIVCIIIFSFWARNVPVKLDKIRLHSENK